MSEIKPNHICRNPKCKKAYYACNFCDKTQSWRSVACSYSCYQKYVDLVIEERTKGKNTEMKPLRTDMTEQEVDTLLVSPIEKVIKETKIELADYVDDEGNIDIMEAVEDVNIKLEKKKTNTRSKKKKSNDE